MRIPSSSIHALQNLETPSISRLGAAASEHSLPDTFSSDTLGLTGSARPAVKPKKNAFVQTIQKWFSSIWGYSPETAKELLSDAAVQARSRITDPVFSDGQDFMRQNNIKLYQQHLADQIQNEKKDTEQYISQIKAQFGPNGSVSWRARRDIAKLTNDSIESIKAHEAQSLEILQSPERLEQELAQFKPVQSGVDSMRSRLSRMLRRWADKLDQKQQQQQQQQASFQAESLPSF